MHKNHNYGVQLFSVGIHAAIILNRCTYFYRRGFQIHVLEEEKKCHLFTHFLHVFRIENKTGAGTRISPVGWG